MLSYNIIVMSLHDQNTRGAPVSAHGTHGAPVNRQSGVLVLAVACGIVELHLHRWKHTVLIALTDVLFWVLS